MLAEVKPPEPKGPSVADRREYRRAKPTAPGTRRSVVARPSPGRGVGRVASAAGYAAQGSPRKPPPEPVLVSAEGLEAPAGRARRPARGAARCDQAHRDGARARRPQGRRPVPRGARRARNPRGPDQGAGEDQAQGRPQVVAPTERGARSGARIARDRFGRRRRDRRFQVVGVGGGEQPRGAHLLGVAGRGGAHGSPRWRRRDYRDAGWRDPLQGARDRLEGCAERGTVAGGHVAAPPGNCPTRCDHHGRC